MQSVQPGIVILSIILTFGLGGCAPQNGGAKAGKNSETDSPGQEQSSLQGHDADQLESCYRKIRDQYTDHEANTDSNQHIQEEFGHELTYLSGGVSLGSHYYLKKIAGQGGFKFIFASFSKKNSQLEVEETRGATDLQGVQGHLTREHFRFTQSCEKNVVTKSSSSDLATDSGLQLYMTDLPVLDPLQSHLLDAPGLSLKDQDGQVYKLDFNKISAVAVGDPKKSGVTSFDGVEIKFEGFAFAQRFYESADRKERYKLVFMNGAINRKIEWLNKSIWLSEPLSREVKITGLTDADILAPKLSLKIKGLSPYPGFFNSDKYMRIVSDQTRGDQWEKVEEFQNQDAPSSVAWDAPLTDEDQKYVLGNQSIQLDAVQAIVDQIRPRLSGLSRIQAATVVTEEIQNLLQYDEKSAAKPDTLDILKVGKGVCYHFSILFASVTRALGIPTRIVGGLIVRPEGLGAHAWNEIKIDQNTWWPIEPQVVGGSLFQRGYLPTGDISEERIINTYHLGLEDLLQPNGTRFNMGLTEITVDAR